MSWAMASKEAQHLPVEFRHAVHGWIDEVLLSRRQKRPYDPSKARAFAMTYERIEKKSAETQNEFDDQLR
jgi:hypothetical protein